MTILSILLYCQLLRFWADSICWQANYAIVLEIAKAKSACILELKTAEKVKDDSDKAVKK